MTCRTLFLRGYPFGWLRETQRTATLLLGVSQRKARKKWPMYLSGWLSDVLDMGRMLQVHTDPLGTAAWNAGCPGTSAEDGVLLEHQPRVMFLGMGNPGFVEVKLKPVISFL